MNSTCNIIFKPSKNDVIFGKGLGAHHHPGNVLYRKIIQEKLTDYNLTETKDEKDMIAYWAFQQVKGRFLKKQEDGTYGIVSKEIAIAKIKQALRDRRKTQMNNSSCNPTKSRKQSINEKNSHDHPRRNNNFRQTRAKVLKAPKDSELSDEDFQQFFNLCEKI